MVPVRGNIKSPYFSCSSYCEYLLVIAGAIRPEFDIVNCLTCVAVSFQYGKT